jgi:hypothetical protein
VAPIGLIVWLVLAIVAMYVPVPYQRRLSFGLEPALAVVAAAGFVEIGARLRGIRAAWFRLGVVALAVNGTLLIAVSVVASGLTNAPLPIYRSTIDLDAGAEWLNQHARSGDVILADWEVSNYLAPRTPARVIGGHPVATLDASAKQSQIAAAFSGSVDASSVARRYGANWIVYGPNDDSASPDASEIPAFSSGGVRIYRLAE